MRIPINESPAVRAGLTAAACLLLLAACAAPPPPPPVPEGAPPAFPAADYVQASAESPVYRVDPQRSLLEVYVYRGGRLARMGHDHVIASRDLAGFVRLDDNGPGSRVEADLYLALAAMTVDEQALRDAAGFDTEPSEEDREGTRGNMLKSLEAAGFPFAVARVRAALPPADQVAVPVEITLHGVSREVRVPIEFAIDDETLSATGSFRLLQSDFGITPFTVLGGALAVQDELALRFDIRARRIDGPADGDVSAY